MDTPEYDIAISGAGPVGSALALLLAGRTSRPERIVLIDKRFAADSTEAPPPQADPRTLALNHGSRALLEQLGAWPKAASEIQTVHVSQRGRLGRTLIRHDELKVPRLGSVVGYESLLAALHQAVGRSGIAIIPATPNTPAVGHNVTLDTGGTTQRARLLIQSDGEKPQGIERDYNQHAVLTVVEASRVKPGWAFERFTATGPLAILPHPAGGSTYAVVWCCAPEQASRLQALDNAQFATELHTMFGDRLGSFSCLTPRHVFPLTLHAGPIVLNSRTVAIGNAAQTLHPVAGQGLNLGLRDAAQLAHALGAWLSQPTAPPEPVLNAFAAQRRQDRWLTTGITDFLPRIFSTRNPLVEHASGLSLLAMDLSATLRAPLARHLLQGQRS